MPADRYQNSFTHFRNTLRSASHLCGSVARLFQAANSGIRQCVSSVQTCRPSASRSSFRYSAVCLFRTDLSPVCFRQLIQAFGSVSLPYRPAARPLLAALSGIQQCIASVRPAARLLRQLFQTPDSVSFPVQTCRPSASSSFFRHSTDMPALCS